MTDPKGTLKAITLELRRELEGHFDPHGIWQPGDLERRLAAIGVRRERAPVPVDELPHLSGEDREARRVVDAFLRSRSAAGWSQGAGVAEFVRESAYCWANRLIALRCMEARGLIDEVILQKESYGGRSLQHQRLARKEPQLCSGEDEGLFGALLQEFARRAEELPLLFDPGAPETALRPSVPSLKRCVALLSGTESAKGQDSATDEVFTAADALGWAYQFWNTDEKARVFAAAAGKGPDRKKHKVEGPDLAPATCFYTDSYMVSFLVQNSLGALWLGIKPTSKLAESWSYFIRDADRPAAPAKAVREITFLDPACGSGHFLIEAFDMFYAMYVEEGTTTKPAEICASILEHNLYGIDIDERAVQFAALALVMKAKEKAPDFVPRRVNLVSTNIRLPAGKEDLEAFLSKHPEDAPLKPAILAIFEGLAHADEIGSLLQIDELVAKELRTLKTQYETAGSPAAQKALWSEYEKPVQGKLPLGVATYEAWQERVLGRIQEHFNAEAHGADLGAAFFGEAAAKGISLVDLLARRYDVVAANPPYMGSKNMGPLLKRHVTRHFAAGKRDLYAAFILRCLQLANDGGRVAMVTQQSWMFLGSFVDLRAVDLSDSPAAFTGILRNAAIETLAHLGRYAFAEIGNAAVAPVMFVFRNAPPSAKHTLWACRLTAPRPSLEQATLLREAAADSRSSLVHRPSQGRLLGVPESPICYWLRDRFFELLAGQTLGEFAEVYQGLATADDPRFVRFVWEVPHSQWQQPVRERAWVPFEKGGGYGKWFGHHFWAVDWQSDGVRIKSTPGPRVQNENHYFSTGWTYTSMASGRLGVRVLSNAIWGAVLADGVIPSSNFPVGALLNCRFGSLAIRWLRPQLVLSGNYVSRIPAANVEFGELSALQASCVALKRWLTALDPIESTFSPIPVGGASLTKAYRSLSRRRDAVAATLHRFEALSERKVFAAYGIQDDDLAAVLEDTGTPAGWGNVVEGYDAPPPLPEGIQDTVRLSDQSLETSRTLPEAELVRLKHRLRVLFEAGPGEAAEAAESPSEGDDEDEDATVASAAQVSMPPETFLEELSQKLGTHPTSIFWLLEDLLKDEGVVCRPLLQRTVEDYVSVLVLRLLGHQWPTALANREVPPAWADDDGIIPITAGTGEPALAARVRERFAEDFGVDNARAVELEFGRIIGKDLDEWLASTFFARHIVKFKKRPVAWQLESRPMRSTERQRQNSSRTRPAFACLVYFHRLDADSLPKVRTQYVGALRTSFQTELERLDKQGQRTGEQDARRVELELKLEELREFDDRVAEVVASGFGSDAVHALLSGESLDKWGARIAGGKAPSTPDSFRAQETRYEPHIDDGVRANIAPLQRAVLLATEVLGAKDVEAAIVDRAKWRMEERRLCREGKLTEPRWWTPMTGKGAA